MMLVASLSVWADNESTIEYDWVYDSANKPIGLRVKSGGAAFGAVTIPETNWGYPVLEIGEYAFQEYKNITSVKIPNTVTVIRKFAFNECTALTKVDFPAALTTIEERAFSRAQNLESITLPNSTKTIGEYAFWNCEKIQSADLGNSLVSIGSYAFQYCRGLKTITLPNTLASVGDHFLCACNGLKTIVIPENLTSIGEYFLHGCENMESVYLMGDKQRNLGNYPFVSQDQQNMKQVSNCVFYVDSEQIYEQYYKNGNNWKYADAANSDYIGDDGHYKNGGNKYQWLPRPDHIRPFEAQWITACYPTEVDAKAAFGDNALVAIMTKAQYKGRDEHGDYLYHIDFELVEDKIMKANTPYLLKADPKNSGSAYIVKHAEDESLKTDEDLSRVIPIDNQSEDPSAVRTSIKMLGTYKKGGRNLNPGEFLFSNNKGKMKFFKQIANGKQRHMGAYRCYWQVVKDDMPATNAKMGAWNMETTAIRTEIYIHHPNRIEVYDLRGKLIGKGKDATIGLPAGIYIVDGKKTIIK